MSSSAVSDPSPEQIVTAATNVASTMSGGQFYAVEGGAACVLLGSTRQTADLHFVVPKGETKAARSLLRSNPDVFHVEKRTNHTEYKSNPPVEIEILAPPALFKEEFSTSTPTIIVNNVRVLKPTLILNAKCGSILGRASEEKKRTDATDIMFLLRWCARNGMAPTQSEVPNATQQFVNYFIATFGRADLWAEAGYNAETGIVYYLPSGASF
ncbi:hypothetical protein GQ53DRAFT_859202 [Thozetella sp. PMI_491]|nr:hypothetical protein GQ53DRAFT_859202 [Thozetella sp. PMI_491]